MLTKNMCDDEVEKSVTDRVKAGVISNIYIMLYYLDLRGSKIKKSYLRLLLGPASWPALTAMKKKKTCLAQNKRRAFSHTFGKKTGFSLSIEENLFNQMLLHRWSFSNQISMTIKKRVKTRKTSFMSKSVMTAARIDHAN